MNNICGHCGTEVAKNFSVCKGCGAHLRRSWRKAILGIVVILFAVPMLTGLIKEFSLYTLLAGVAVLGIGVLIIRSALTKKWYRHNS